MDPGAAATRPRPPHGAAASQCRLGAPHGGRAHGRGRVPGADAGSDRRGPAARRHPLVRALADRLGARSSARSPVPRRGRCTTGAPRASVSASGRSSAARPSSPMPSGSCARVAGGETAALLVRGPTGIGKSALCREVVNRAHEGGWRVITVTATASGAPYAPIGAAIEQLLVGGRASLDALPQRTRSVLAELSPLARPAPPAAGRADPPSGRRRAAACARAASERLAERAVRRGRSSPRRGDRGRPAPARGRRRRRIRCS